ncbi:mitochondrial 54S ribosomal protein YmL23 [Starmerella bacillaris]|uniref:Mitochondrial 54S ribosomal protein YmL23 n=1 Tax=Starmerella bacillaris TaxID=1247836 RepID=A0AAV5RFP0_STABA|nr:mitochondrial 54S ribosomal protein YmL23 [Starmerella bacillaris]
MSKYIGRTALGLARTWHHVDVASDPRPLGRLAASIAIALQGKHKPLYYQGSDCGDYVVVTNCQHVYATGKKEEHKLYRWHSGRVGNLHEVKMKDMRIRHGGGELLRRAVKGMLPKNQLREHRLARLKLVEGSSNPYSQNIIAFHDDAVATDSKNV